MTISIQLSDKQTAALKAKAQAHSISVEQYSGQVLGNDLGNGARPRRHIAEVIRNNIPNVPKDNFGGEAEGCR